MRGIVGELAAWHLHVAETFGGNVAVIAALFLVTGLVPVPRTPLCIITGALVGLPAVPVVACSSAVGGVIAFLMSRHLFRAGAERWLHRRRIADALARAVDVEGWKIVALMRFYGPVPTTVQNYAFGLTRIPLAAYAGATLVFSVPQIAFYVYLGATGRDVAEGASWLQAGAAVVLAGACLTTTGLLVAARCRSILRRDAGSASRGLPHPGSARTDRGAA